MTALLASVAELAMHLRPTPVETDRAELFLEGTSAEAIDAAGERGATWTGDTVPAQVRSMVLRIAGRAYTNPTSLAQEAIAGYSYTAGELGVTLNAAERALCRRLAGGRSMHSVSLLATLTDP